MILNFIKDQEPYIRMTNYNHHIMDVRFTECYLQYTANHFKQAHTRQSGCITLPFNTSAYLSINHNLRHHQTSQVAFLSTTYSQQLRISYGPVADLRNDTSKSLTYTTGHILRLNGCLNPRSCLHRPRTEAAD